MEIEINFLAGRDSRLKLNKTQFKSFIKWLEDDKEKSYFLYEEEGFHEYIFKHAIVKVIYNDYYEL